MIFIIILIYMFLKSPFTRSPTKIAEYAITDQRIIITYNSLINRVQAFSLSAINSIRIEKNSFNGSKEIIFGEYKSSNGINHILVATDEIGKKGTMAPKFIDLDNPAEVIEILSSKAINAQIYGAHIDENTNFERKKVEITDQAELNKKSVEDMLEADEKVLWHDSASGILFGEHSKVLTLIISLLLFLGLYSYEKYFPNYKTHSLFFMIVLGLNFLIILYRYLKDDPSLGKANEYYITNQKVIIIKNALRREVQTFSLQAMDQIFIKKSFFVNPDIIIGKYKKSYAARVGLGRSGYRRSRRLIDNSELGRIDDAPPQFISIKDVEGLKHTLEQYTQCQIKTGYYENC